MQARIHKYVSNSHNPDELRSSGRAMLAELGSMPGLVSFVMLDVGEGQLVSVCICEEAAMLDAVDTVAAAFHGCITKFGGRPSTENRAN